MIKSIILIGIFLNLLFPASAIEIDIFYPINNTTTEMYYSEGSEYKTIIGNSIEGNFSILIIKNQKEYQDILHHPEKAIGSFTGYFLIIFVILMIVLVIARVIRVMK